MGSGEREPPFEIVEEVFSSHPATLGHRDHGVENRLAVAGGMEMLKAGLNRPDARAQNQVRIQCDLEAHRLQVCGRDDRRTAALDHVGELDARKDPADLRELFPCAGRLDEEDVGSRFMIGMRPPQGFRQTGHRDRIGAGDQDQIVVPARLDRRPDFHHRLVDGNQLFPFEVAALLRNHLILQLHGGHAGTDEFLNGAVEVDGVTIAGVDVGDQRNADRSGHLPDLLQHLGHRRQPDVGERELTVRNAGAGGIHDREPSQFDQPRGQAVVRARRNDQVVVSQQLPEVGRL